MLIISKKNHEIWKGHFAINRIHSKSDYARFQVSTWKLKATQVLQDCATFSNSLQNPRVTHAH